MSAPAERARKFVAALWCRYAELDGWLDGFDFIKLAEEHGIGAATGDGLGIETDMKEWLEGKTDG